MKTVVILDCDFGDGAVERDILAAADLELVVADVSGEDEAMQAVRNAVGIITQYVPVTARVLDAAPMLRAVVRYGVGLDPIDLDAADSRGVRVSGVPDYCTDEVADHTMALILAATRSVVAATRETAAGRWPGPDELPLMRALRGSTLGLLGFGRVARAVAERAHAFGTRVVAHDPGVDADSIRTLGVEPAEFGAVFEAEVVSLHLPLNDSTRGIVGPHELGRIRRGAVLVNASRGGLIDEEALLASLDAGRPTVAALDVLSVERQGGRIAAHPNVILTPHVAYYSPDSLRRLREMAASTMVRLIAG